MDEKEIFLHADTPLTKEQAEAIEKAIAAIGPIHLAGMGLKSVQEKTTKLIEIGIEKMEAAEKVFEEQMDPDSLPEDPQREIRRLKEQVDQLTKERDEWKAANEFHRQEVEKGNQYREKLKETIVKLHDRINDKNIQLDIKERLIQGYEEDLERANRVIDFMTRKKGC